MKPVLVLIVALLLLSCCYAQQSKQLLWSSNSYSLYRDSIVQQNKFVAKAISGKAITSNYKSPVNEFKSPNITFKFSINGKDNEMKSGIDHHFNCIDSSGKCTTPVIKFGQQYNDDRSVPENVYLKPQTNLTIRLDMRDVLHAFEKDGYYTTFNGDKIFKQDFKGVYVAGSTAPLIWDFDNLVNNPRLMMKDEDGDGVYEVELLMNSQADEKKTSSEWMLTEDISAFPQYQSTYPISDAIYNMSLEEMQRAIEPDSTFRTGKEWAGVWTRDISYSIILSMACLQPRVAMKSLMRKVKNGKIIQDTGTGGAYPASTDRIVWAVAAWEIYKVTGDKNWLKQVYPIIKKSIEQDMLVAYDKATGLVKGESSFLDWREQTYPKWMQPVDIYESECLATNAVHHEANMVLSSMAAILKDIPVSIKHKKIALAIKEGINKYLWMPSKGYYGQFLYGRNAKILSTRSESLGEALAVLFDIADTKQQQVIKNTPVTSFGIPCIYPQIPNIPPYHNNAVWPFVQTYWALAAAKAGNEAAVLASIAAIYRPAALWLTNKENFVSVNGDYAGTQINSDNMLWSLSGSLALVHKLLFGIQFNENSLSFQPFVPYALQGKRKLSNFVYRDAQYDIEMEGFGNRIKTFMLDGKMRTATVPADLEGKHVIKIIMANNNIKDKSINNAEHYVSLPAPSAIIEKDQLQWNEIKEAKEYIVLINGKEIARTKQNVFAVNKNIYGEYQVIAIDDKNIPSFASEPVVVAGKNQPLIYEIEDETPAAELPYKGFTGKGFVELNTTINRSLKIPVTIASDGLYAIDFRYANGNGPTNTENKCAIRTLKEGNKQLGTLVLPQRGKEEWSNWGWSNAIQARLIKGKHFFTISFEPQNENMNGDINQAMLDHMRITRIK